MYNNFVITSVVYDKSKHPLSTPEMKAQRYVRYFMSSLFEIVRLMNFIQKHNRCVML